MADKSILVVDDEAAMQELITELLDILGHVAHTASTASEALNKLNANVVDLCLVDLQLPGMKGDELAREIKQRRPQLPVILVTGRRLQTPPPDVDWVLLKPFSLGELRQAISHFG
jgi:CheY-like chemotaxis protein